MKAKYTYWKESDGMFLGYLNEFPDHWTQGIDLEELKENLVDLYKTFTSEDINCDRDKFLAAIDKTPQLQGKLKFAIAKY